MVKKDEGSGTHNTHPSVPSDIFTRSTYSSFYLNPNEGLKPSAQPFSQAPCTSVLLRWTGSPPPSGNQQFWDRACCWERLGWPVPGASCTAPLRSCPSWLLPPPVSPGLPPELCCPSPQSCFICTKGSDNIQALPKPPSPSDLTA